MIIATVIAVALGLTPVDMDTPDQVVSGNFEQQVGAYRQTTDARGIVHVRGVHPRSRAAYELTITPAGLVNARIGDRDIEFQIRSST